MRLDNFFGIGTQSKSRAVTPATLVNVFVEPRPAGERSQIVAYGIPGLDLFSNAGATPWRGMLVVETTSFFYGVHRGVFYQVDNNGTRTSKGALNTSSGRVSMAHNGTDVLVVDGTNGWIYNIAGDTFTQVTAAGFPVGAKSAAWLDQLFIVENGVVFATSPDGLAWDATEQGVPESSPDGIETIIADHGELTVLGVLSTEFWTASGAGDFAFAPLKSATAEWGLVATASLCKANDSLTYLAKNSDGQASVVRLRGHAPEVISTPDIDHILNSFSTLADATALAYKVGGHPFYQLNAPTGDMSFLFDAFANRWTRVKSYGMGRHRGEMAIQYLGRTIIADEDTGALYTLNPDSFTENGNAIESELISDVVRLPDGERFPVDCLRLDMETGVGILSGQGSDPQVMLQVSRDGGATWGAEMWRSVGKLGKYGRRVEWRRLGTADAWAFKTRFTDPVKRVFVSASINPSD